MKASLVNYEVDLKNLVKKSFKIPKETAEEIINIVQALKASYTATEYEIDTSAISRGLLDTETELSVNSRGNKIYSVALKGYLPDSKDFVGPVNIWSNNVSNNDIDENVLAHFIMEEVGYVDTPPPTSPLFHVENTRRSLNDKDKTTIVSSYPGVASKLRASSLNADGLCLEFTCLTTSSKIKGEKLWLCFILTRKSNTMGSNKTVRVFATTGTLSTDSKPEILN